MNIHSIARRAFQSALIPVLVLAVSTGAAQAQGRGHAYGHDNHDNHDNRGQDFHFRYQDRGNFAPHYQKDISRWQRNPHGRPVFTRGQRIPSNYRFRAVPRSYYANVPPPPPGYQYGYYDGYVVSYNPTTRIIADVLDLVTSATVNR